MKIIRWIARIWTIPILVVAVMMMVAPDPNLVTPVPLADRIIMGFLYVSVLGLLVAWRLEGLGGAIAVAGFVGHVLAIVILAGEQVNPALMGSAVFGSFLLPPAVLFLIYWKLGRQEVETSLKSGEAES